MTDEEMKASLFPLLGVYGDWIVKHGKHLNQSDPLVQNIMKVYEMFYKHADTPTIGMLMGAIDCFCHNRNFEKPADHL